MNDFSAIFRGYEFRKVGAVNFLLFSLVKVVPVSLLNSSEDIVTTNGFLVYEIIHYIDHRTAKSNDGMLYGDDIVQNCSILMLNLLSFSKSPVLSNQAQVQFLIFAVNPGTFRLQYNR